MLAIEPFHGGSDFERVKAVLHGEIPDRVPNFEILIEDAHVQQLLGRYAGNTLGVGGDPAKGSEAAEGVRPMHAADYLELCHTIGQDAMALEAFWTPLKHVRPDGAVGPITDRSIHSRADLDRIIWPTEADMEERLQYVREYVGVARGTGVGVAFCGCCIFQTLYEFVMGMANCMTAILTDRDLVVELMSRSADYYAALNRRVAALGVDLFFAADDFAFKNGLLVEPSTFAQIWREPFERVLAPFHEVGIPIIFHSDGRLDDAVEMLIDMGVHCLTPMDPSGIDYRDYKKRYGRRVALHGNIDLTWPLIGGTPEDVERDVLDHMAVLKPGGGWIAGSSHSIVNYVPHHNFIAMLNAIHRHGTY